MRRAFTMLEILVAMGLIGLLSLLISQFVRFFLPYTARLSERTRLQALSAQILSRMRADCSQRVPEGLWVANKPGESVLLVLQTPAASARASGYLWLKGLGLQRSELGATWLESQGANPPADPLLPLTLGNTTLNKWTALDGLPKPSGRWPAVTSFEVSALPSTPNQLGKCRVQFALQGHDSNFSQSVCLP